MSCRICKVNPCCCKQVKLPCDINELVCTDNMSLAGSQGIEGPQGDIGNQGGGSGVGSGPQGPMGGNAVCSNVSPRSFSSTSYGLQGSSFPITISGDTRIPILWGNDYTGTNTSTLGTPADKGATTSHDRNFMGIAPVLPVGYDTLGLINPVTNHYAWRLNQLNTTFVSVNINLWAALDQITADDNIMFLYIILFDSSFVEKARIPIENISRSNYNNIFTHRVNPSGSSGVIMSTTSTAMLEVLNTDIIHIQLQLKSKSVGTYRLLGSKYHITIVEV